MNEKEHEDFKRAVELISGILAGMASANVASEEIDKSGLSDRKKQIIKERLALLPIDFVNSLFEKLDIKKGDQK